MRSTALTQHRSDAALPVPQVMSSTARIGDDLATLKVSLEALKVAQPPQPL